MKDFDYVPILFFDSKSGRRAELTPEQVHSRQLNQWKDWYCASGNRSLYIDFDGNVFVGTCEVGGWRGNLYREGLDVEALDKWVKCTRKFCSCGSDMYSPKVKHEHLIPKNLEHFRRLISLGFKSDKSDEVSDLNDPDLVLCRNGIHFRSIIWDLGRRCNLACTYCYPGSHNNYESHKTLNSLKHAVDKVSDLWQRGERGVFLITGGEPTVNPSYIEFVEYIMSKNLSNSVTTSTNGSRDPKYFAQLFPVSSLNFSAHLETLQNERAYTNFIESIAMCVEMKKSGEVARSRYLQVRIMLKPGMLELAQRLRDDIRSIPDFNRYAAILGSLLHQSEEKTLMPQYSESEKQFVSETQV